MERPEGIYKRTLKVNRPRGKGSYHKSAKLILRYGHLGSDGKSPVFSVVHSQGEEAFLVHVKKSLYLGNETGYIYVPILQRRCGGIFCRLFRDLFAWIVTSSYIKWMYTQVLA